MTTTEAATAGTKSTRRMSLPVLIGMVVGSMVGAGVFSLPRNFAEATGVLGAIIAWVIAGVGMLMLAFVFQTLAVRKPELDAGVYAYAKAGFGEFPGFLSAFGYWASACVGNVFYWVLIKSTIGLVVPAFGEGDTLLAVIVSAIAVWAFHFMIMRGVKEAAVINQIVTVAKLIPIAVFVVILVVTLQSGVFADNFWGDASLGGVFGQVRATMLVTVFVFLGVEGASVYSRYAQRRRDVGRATVLGFLSVLALFASVTLLSYGALPRADIEGVQQPSMAGVMEAVVGGWGSHFIGAGLIISVLGAYLAWTLMAAEVLYVAAKDDDMPRFLKRDNDHGAPANALILTSSLITAVLVITLFSEDAFTFTLELTSSLSLVPYLLAAGYALRIAVEGDTYDSAPQGRGRETAIAALAVLYTLFIIFAAGLEFLLLSCIIYAAGTALFVLTRKEQNRRPFAPPELALFLVTLLGAIAGLVGLVAGWITI